MSVYFDPAGMVVDRKTALDAHGLTKQDTDLQKSLGLRFGAPAFDPPAQTSSQYVVVGSGASSGGVRNFPKSPPVQNYRGRAPMQVVYQTVGAGIGTTSTIPRAPPPPPRAFPSPHAGVIQYPDRATLGQTALTSAAVLQRPPPRVERQSAAPVIRTSIEDPRKRHTSQQPPPLRAVEQPPAVNQWVRRGPPPPRPLDMPPKTQLRQFVPPPQGKGRVPAYAGYGGPPPQVSAKPKMRLA